MGNLIGVNAMNDETAELDQTEKEALACTVPDDVLETVAGKDKADPVNKSYSYWCHSSCTWCR